MMKRSRRQVERSPYELYPEVPRSVGMAVWEMVLWIAVMAVLTAAFLWIAWSHSR